MQSVERRLVTPFYFLSSRLARLLLFLFTRWQVKGKEKVPPRGALLVVANHLHFTDPAILIASLPRRVTFMAKEELFHSQWRWVVRGVGAFPVRRERLGRQALLRAQAALERGLAVGIFPEGGRSRSGGLQPALPGASFLAARFPVPLLPVAIWGSEKLTGLSGLLRRPRVTVHIGEPFSLPSHNGKIRKEALDQATQLIMRHIAQLLPPSYQGAYQRDGDAD